MVDLIYKCPICAAQPAVAEYKNVFDDRYGYPGKFEILRCQNCNHRFCTPQLASGQIAEVYSYYGRRATNSASVKEAAQKSTKVSKFSRYLRGVNNQGQNFAPPESILLDVGSGDCSNLLEAKLLGHDSVGFDVDEETNRIARDLSLEVKIGQSALDVYGDRTFSWIQLNQVIEHLLEPEQELRKLSTLLLEEGRIFIATPNVNSVYRFLFQKRWLNWHTPYHQHHFSRNSLSRLLDKAGLEVTNWHSVTPVVWIQVQLAMLSRPASPGEPSPVWKENTVTTSRAMGNLSSAFLRAVWILSAPIITIVARALDAMGLGDCQVAIVKRKT
jgi:2-polyprenyl-3-methyl-5-hydroxy-6-metoxy-1,4-benzoquinol methylase